MNWGEKKKKKERESNEENLDGKYLWIRELPPALRNTTNKPFPATKLYVISDKESSPILLRDQSSNSSRTQKWQYSNAIINFIMGD